MSKEYVFEFPGTKEDFLNRLGQFDDSPYSNKKFYCVDDYIIIIYDTEIHFGIERTGHSNGNWYISTITDRGDTLEFRGTIQNDGQNDNVGPIKKVFNKIDDFLFFVLVLPIIFIIRFCMFINWLVKKLRHQPTPKTPTTEARLFDLMENHLGCIRK